MLLLYVCKIVSLPRLKNGVYRTNIKCYNAIRNYTAKLEFGS